MRTGSLSSCLGKKIKGKWRETIVFNAVRTAFDHDYLVAYHCSTLFSLTGFLALVQMFTNLLILTFNTSETAK